MIASESASTVASETGISRFSFLGHCITKDSLEVDTENVKAINYLAAATNSTELRRFIGMVNHLFPNFTDVMQLPRNLLQKDVSCVWSDTQQCAFKTIQQMLSTTPGLAFFDPNIKDYIVERRQRIWPGLGPHAR